MFKQRVNASLVRPDAAVTGQRPGETHAAAGFAWLRSVAALLLFGAAFGYLEAAVVSYLRIVHEPARRHYYPDRKPGDLFPLLTLERLRARDRNSRKRSLSRSGARLPR